MQSAAKEVQGNDEKKTYHCGRCGQSGHNSETCTFYRDDQRHLGQLPRGAEQILVQSKESPPLASRQELMEERAQTAATAAVAACNNVHVKAIAMAAAREALSLAPPAAEEPQAELNLTLTKPKLYH